jgi:hypothetical protein
LKYPSLVVELAKTSQKCKPTLKIELLKKSTDARDVGITLTAAFYGPMVGASTQSDLVKATGEMNRFALIPRRHR